MKTLAIGIWMGVLLVVASQIMTEVRLNFLGFDDCSERATETVFCPIVSWVMK